MMTIDELAEYSSIKQKTIKQNYSSIPGVIKQDGAIIIPDGTRYPYDAHRYKFKDMGTRYAALLDATSTNRYIDNEKLCLDTFMFDAMITDLLKTGFLCENGNGNMLGANRYSTTLQYEIIKDERIQKRKQIIANLLAQFGANLVSCTVSKYVMASV